MHRGPGFEVRAGAADAALAEGLAQNVRVGLKQVQKFFGQPWRHRFVVRIFPDRKSLDRHWRTKWKEPAFSSKCWMVASAVQDELSMLSPRAWKEQACEHDPTDETHLQNLITHELVHVYQDQYNPTDGYEGMEKLGWFVEGLATFVSGQLSEGHLASPREAVELGKVPAKLSHAWKGKYRYGVCGSLVQLVHRRVGRERLFELLAAVQTRAILDALAIDEERLLSAWQAHVRETYPLPPSLWATGPCRGSELNLWTISEGCKYDTEPDRNQPPGLAVMVEPLPKPVRSGKPVTMTLRMTNTGDAPLTLLLDHRCGVFEASVHRKKDGKRVDIENETPMAMLCSRPTPFRITLEPGGTLRAGFEVRTRTFRRNKMSASLRPLRKLRRGRYTVRVTTPFRSTVTGELVLR